MPRQYNYYAGLIRQPSNGITLLLDQEFANYLDDPYISHTKGIDRAAIEEKIYASGTSVTEERLESDRRNLDRINDKLEETAQKQAFYILRTVAAKTGRSEELEKELRYATDGLDGSDFLHYLHRYAKGEINGEKTELDNEVIEEIIRDSAKIENIGTPENEDDFDLIRYNRTNDYLRFEKQFTEHAQNNALDISGYTRAELDEAFEGCFNSSYPAKPYPNMLKEARFALLRERMNALPESERSEKAFCREWQKLNVALKAYVFPVNDAEFTPEQAFEGISADELRTFASSTINRTSTVASLRDAYHNLFDDRRDDHEKSERDYSLDTMASHINHLKRIYEKRSFGEKFRDFFHFRNGERAVIRQMTSKLKELYHKDDVEEALAENNDSIGNSLDKHVDEVESKRYLQISNTLHDQMIDLARGIAPREPAPEVERDLVEIADIPDEPEIEVNRAPVSEAELK